MTYDDKQFMALPKKLLVDLNQISCRRVGWGAGTSIEALCDCSGTLRSLMVPQAHGTVSDGFRHRGTTKTKITSITCEDTRPVVTHKLL